SAWFLAFHDPVLTWRIVSTNAMLLGGVIPRVFGLVSWPLTLGALAVALCGVSGTAREHLSLAARLTLVYLIVFLGPPYPMERYCTPLVPFAYVFLVIGALQLGRWVSAEHWAAVPLILLCALNGTWILHFRAVTRTAIHGEYGRPMPFAWDGFEETIAW